MGIVDFENMKIRKAVIPVAGPSTCLLFAFWELCLHGSKSAWGGRAVLEVGGEGEVYGFD